jgi:ABC-type transport system substrate-binding protein
MKFKAKIIAVSIFAMLICSFAPLSASASEYKDEMVIRLAADMANLHPAHSIGLLTYYVHTQIFDSIAKYNPDGVAVPSLAEGWDISKDGLTWTVRIHPDAKFSDGTKVSAQDVKYIYDITLDPKTASPRRAKIDSMVKDIVVKDDKTLEFKLKGPASLFADHCFFLPIAKPESIKKYGENYNNHAVGAGLYKLKQWVPGEKIVLERNEYHHRAVAATPRLAFKIIPDSMTAQIELEEGAIDLLMDIQQSDLPRFEGNKSIKLVKAAPLNVRWLVFNKNVPPFDDIDIRRAISHAVDRDAIAETILAGIGKKADGFMPDQYPAYEPNTVPYDYDLKKTDESMAKAGYKKNDQGFWEKDGKKLTVPLHLRSRSPESEIIEAVHSYLVKAGFDAKIMRMEDGQFIQELREKNKFGTYFLGISQDYSDPIGFLDLVFYKNGVWNHSGFDNPRVNEIIERTLEISDQDERTRLFKEAQKIIKEDYPALPLAIYFNQAGVNAKMEGYVHSAAWLELTNVKIAK